MAAGLTATALVAALLLPVWHGVAIAAGNAFGITCAAALMLAGQRSTLAAVSLAVIGRSVLRLVGLAVLAGLSAWLVSRLMEHVAAAVVAGTGLVVVSGVFVLLGLLTGADEVRWLGILIRRTSHAR